MPRDVRHPIPLLGVLVGAACALASCGGGSSDSNTDTQAASTASQKTAIAVPARVKAKGTLTIATDATYPPVEFVDQKKGIVGFDPDLAHAIADATGLDVKVVNVPFDGIVPGLAAGKYDIGMAAMTDTKEREQAVDFVTYYRAGTSFYTPVDGGDDITGLDDLCGHTVAVEKGTTQADDGAAQSKKCTAAGKPAVKVLVFPDQNGANLALSSGRGDVGMADSPVAAYLVKQSGGKFKLTGQAYGEAPYGVAVPKDSGLQTPIRDALKQLIADGRYKAILAKWGLEQGGIDEPVVNGAEG